MIRNFVVFLFLLVLSQQAIAEKEIDISNAFYGKDLDQVNYKDAQSAMRLWLHKLAKIAKVESNLHFYHDFDKLQKAVKRGKVDAIFLSPMSYVENEHYLKQNFAQGWLKKEEDGKPFFRYILLKRKESPSKGLYLVEYFRYGTISKSVVQMYGWQHHLHFKFKKTLKESKPVLDLFFKKCDYAIVKASTWSLMQELNPQLTQQLKVVHTSKRVFVDMVALFSKRMSKEGKKKYIESMNAINTTEAGRQLMRLFKFNGLIFVKGNEFAPLEVYYSKYLKTKAKHQKY